MASRGYALSGGNLLSFDPANPSLGATIAITGVTLGETLVGIDFRPQNGFLYGLGVNAGADTATLYAISSRTGLASPVGTPGGVVLFGASANRLDLPSGGYGFDFNPATDRIRVTTDSSLNFRINPNTGAAIDGDPGVQGTNPDGQINGPPPESQRPPSPTTSPTTAASQHFTLSTHRPKRCSSRTLRTAGRRRRPSPLRSRECPRFHQCRRFDIVSGVNATVSNAAVTAGSGLATLTVGGIPGLYSFNLLTGQASLLGSVLNGVPLTGLAIQSDLGGAPVVALSSGGSDLVRFSTNVPSTTNTQSLAGINTGEVMVGIDFRPATGH